MEQCTRLQDTFRAQLAFLDGSSLTASHSISAQWPEFEASTIPMSR